MAESVDAMVSNTIVCKDMPVRVRLPVLNTSYTFINRFVTFDRSGFFMPSAIVSGRKQGEYTSAYWYANIIVFYVNPLTTT